MPTATKTTRTPAPRRARRAAATNDPLAALAALEAQVADLAAQLDDAHGEITTLTEQLDEARQRNSTLLAEKHHYERQRSVERALGATPSGREPDDQAPPVLVAVSDDDLMLDAAPAPTNIAGHVIPLQRSAFSMDAEDVLGEMRTIANELAGALRPYTLFREQRVEDANGKNPRVVVDLTVPGRTLTVADRALTRFASIVKADQHRRNKQQPVGALMNAKDHAAAQRRREQHTDRIATTAPEAQAA
jgi:hypothetical protein